MLTVKITGKQRTMFLAGDEAEVREHRIWRHFRSEPSVALILAAINFEWTVCWAVLFLSATPNSKLRKGMAQYYGLEDYKELWKSEVSSPRSVPGLAQIVRNWSTVREAFRARNLLVHGRDRYTTKMARPHIDALLKGAAYVESYCLSLGFPLASRMPVRRRQGFSLARPSWVSIREENLRVLTALAKPTQ